VVDDRGVVEGCGGLLGAGSVRSLPESVSFVQHARVIEAMAEMEQRAHRAEAALERVASWVEENVEGSQVYRENGLVVT
jgi:hypothetical protein